LEKSASQRNKILAKIFNWKRFNTLTLIPCKVTQRILVSQNGFALIWLCFILPVILTATTFVYVGITQIEIKSILHQICRSELLEAQAQASKMIHQMILSSNLHHTLPPSQFIYIFTNHLKQSLLKGKNKIHQSLINFQNKSKPLINFSNMEIQGIFDPSLSVEIIDNDPLIKTPYLRVKEHFVQLQSLSLYWRYRLQLTPSFHNWGGWSQVFKGHCSATLTKERPWIPILYEAKHF